MSAADSGPSAGEVAPDKLAQLVLDAASDEVEVGVLEQSERFVRFSDRGPTQNADRTKHVLSVRARFSGPDGIREARAETGRMTEAAARAALARAEALARVAAPDPELVPLGGPVEVQNVAPVAATRDHGFAEKARWVELALAKTGEHQLVPAGLAQSTIIRRALWNSAGRHVEGAISRASFGLYAGSPSIVDGRAGDGPGGDAGFASELDADVDRIDAEAAVCRAVDKARRASAPCKVDPGEYTVVLEPHAISALLLFAGYQGFGARAVEEEQSFLCGRIGQRTFGENIDVSDDAFDPMLPGFAFDGEGAPRQRVKLIEAGVVRNPVTDGRYAKKLGIENTGHALCQPSADGPRPDNLHFAPGQTPDDDLLRGIEHGLLVTQFHYTNVIDPRELMLTGMTRGGTFLIENGEVGSPVRNLRFTQSLVEALSRVSALTRSATAAGALFDGEAVVPGVRIDGFRFTSTTDF